MVSNMVLMVFILNFKMTLAHGVSNLLLIELSKNKCSFHKTWYPLINQVFEFHRITIQNKIHFAIN